MADTKISALPAGSALAGTEDMIAVQAAADVRTTPDAIRTYILAQANSFTAQQSVYNSGSVLAITLAGAAAGGTVALAATAPAQVASATAGTPLSVTASAAIAGSSVAGAAAGGSVTITGGAAARLTSGNANGGDINLTPGAGIGSGIGGSVIVAASTANTTPAIKFGTTNTGFQCGTNQLQLFTNGINTTAYNFTSTHLTSTTKVGFRTSVSDTAGAPDVALWRNAAAVLEVNNGTNGQFAALRTGTSDTNNASITTGLTLAHQRASGAAVAAGFGMGMLINLESTTTQDRNALGITAEWVVATDASRTARAKFNVYDTAVREALRLEASGSAPMIGFLGSAATVKAAITGSRGGNAALANLLTELAAKGLITDSTTA